MPAEPKQVTVKCSPKGPLAEFGFRAAVHLDPKDDATFFEVVVPVDGSATVSPEVADRLKASGIVGLSYS